MAPAQQLDVVPRVELEPSPALVHATVPELEPVPAPVPLPGSEPVPVADIEPA